MINAAIPNFWLEPISAVLDIHYFAAQHFVSEIACLQFEQGTPVESLEAAAEKSNICIDRDFLRPVSGHTKTLAQSVCYRSARELPLPTDQVGYRRSQAGCTKQIPQAEDQVLTTHAACS